MIAYFRRPGSNRSTRKRWSGRWRATTRSQGEATVHFELAEVGGPDGAQVLAVSMPIEELREALETAEGFRHLGTSPRPDPDSYPDPGR